MHKRDKVAHSFKIRHSHIAILALKPFNSMNGWFCSDKNEATTLLPVKNAPGRGCLEYLASKVPSQDTRNANSSSIFGPLFHQLS